VEVFKMPGGTEYILHDVDENNYIIGKVRISGHVKVSEAMSVDGFGGHSILDDLGPARIKPKDDEIEESSKKDPPPTFHPPSFGVTVLGNSHGFDKSGSVSGYVLWINGRGVMIDPPPYSSATLEREGIRPRMIVGIVLTHCHADHDAGAFQKVLTGSPVVVITTPTIYKSFIRKYAALSALSPALLRHSHRYKPAIIGQPLRFQGATFYFTYTLHTIPCVGFRVEWRGRSMVFTGDHFNSPEAIDMLQSTGVLTKARADDLRFLPLQETDVLLHEAGAPPIHTPLDVLLKLPARVKKRLYVVHTSALPEGCELRVAPTGTAGTIRLDQTPKVAHKTQLSFVPGSVKLARENSASLHPVGEDMWNGNEYHSVGGSLADDSITGGNGGILMTSFAHVGFNTSAKPRASLVPMTPAAPPLVSLRPPSSTDAWFILNLLSAVPFLARYVRFPLHVCLFVLVCEVFSHIVVYAVFRMAIRWNY
jgi:glyoxylase-like metal-dependent hydrolase (beta-lactamase superfamily II)